MSMEKVLRHKAICDELMDLANYAIMTILEMDGEEASMLYAYGRPVEFVKEGTSLCGNENS